MSHTTLMNEDFPARIEAVFPSHESATAAAKTLCQRFEFDGEQLSIGSAEQHQPRVHRNRYAFKASGRKQQQRQIAATLVAFTLIIVGLGVLHMLGADQLPTGLTYAIMGGLIIAAVAITIIGLVSWRPARVDTRYKARPGEAVLVINVHDVTEQYALREALLEMGARIEGPVSASVS